MDHARHIPADLDQVIVADIDKRLDGVESAEGVRILWAVESGSRAWGFPSPDSDYDARFIYARPRDDYLSPWLPRDVIETPLDRIFDVNGWELRKVVDLMTRGHATALEWLRSPIIYRGDPAARQTLLDLAERIAEPELLGRHYANVGAKQWERCGAATSDGQRAKLKGVFYALRPAAVLHWMTTTGLAVPPMRLQELLAEAAPDPDVVDAVAELIATKSRTREMGTGTVPEPVNRFVAAQLSDPRWAGTGIRRIPEVEAQREAARVFRDMIAPAPS